MKVKFKIKKSPVKMNGKKTTLLCVIVPSGVYYMFMERYVYATVKKDPKLIFTILQDNDSLTDEIKMYVNRDQGFILNKKNISMA